MIKNLVLMLLTIAFAVFVLAMPARADLQDEMNVFFDSLANTTDPTITSTARRGVIAGGSVQIRNRIVDTNSSGLVLMDHGHIDCRSNS